MDSVMSASHYPICRMVEHSGIFCGILFFVNFSHTSPKTYPAITRSYQIMYGKWNNFTHVATELINTSYQSTMRKSWKYEFLRKYTYNMHGNRNNFHLRLYHSYSSIILFSMLYRYKMVKFTTKVVSLML